MLESLLPHWDDEGRRRAMAIASRKELEEQFELERQALATRGVTGWHFEPDEAAGEASRPGPTS